MSGKQINSYGRHHADVTDTQLRQHNNTENDLETRIRQLEENGMGYTIDNGVLVVETSDIYNALDARRGVTGGMS